MASDPGVVVAAAINDGVMPRSGKIRASVARKMCSCGGPLTRHRKAAGGAFSSRKVPLKNCYSMFQFYLSIII